MSLPTLALLGPLLAGFSHGPPQMTCDALPELLTAMQVKHYARETVAPVSERRAVDKYIEVMDSAKMLFLESEVKAFRKRLPRVFDRMRDGDCKLLEEVAALSVQRARADARFVRSMLGDGYKLDESVELELDADTRGYPKTRAEREKRLAAMVHFQVSNQLISGAKLDKAKARVAHRYELVERRLKERREPQDLPEIMAKAFASGLDPHSDFFSAKDLEDFRISMRLSLEGIGAVLRSEDGYTRIQSVVPGGAADKEGTLRPKDKIVAVAQAGEEPVSTIDMDLREVVRMIRGKKGTTVVLTVLREGKDTRTFDISIVRDKIDVKDQAAKITYETRKVGKKSYKIGVLDLPSFYGGNGGRSAYEDVKNLLKEAKAEKVDGLVLDLSENGGGLLDFAVKISGLFIETGGVVATKASSGEVEVLSDEDDSTVYSGPLVVLISGASASASEIVAGALKDYGRAVVAGGAQTFGKGTVQQLQPLPGGLGALKLTMGMFFRPSGGSTQQRGVRSDLGIPSIMDGYDLAESELDHPLPHQSIPPFVSGSSSGRGKVWAPVDAGQIAKLRKASKARVAKADKLQEIVKDAKEARKEKKRVKLSELRKKALEDKDEAANEDDDEASKKAYEAKQAAFVAEGVDIAVDLVRLQR